jgi:hypothetical protein
MWYVCPKCLNATSLKPKDAKICAGCGAKMQKAPLMPQRAS